jgi:hypothetical protein
MVLDRGRSGVGACLATVILQGETWLPSKLQQNARQDVE